MKKNIRKILSFILVFGFIAVCASAAYGGTPHYKNTVNVADGLTYENVVRTTSGGRVESFALTIDPNEGLSVMASDGGDIYGGCTINYAVNQAEKMGYNTLAAVNSDFFSMSTGVPTGIFIENGMLVSSDDGANAIGFMPDGAAVIGRPGVSLDMTNKSNGRTFKIMHYNKTPTQYTFNMLDRQYESSVSLSGKWRIAVITQTSGKMVLGERAEFTVSDIIDFEGGRYTIPENSKILVAKADTSSASRFDNFAKGDTLELAMSGADTRFNDALYACGGGDILVSNGSVTSSSSWKDPGGKNPRSAVGITGDGKIVILTADGRQSSYSVGLTLTELANEMAAYGCTYALNLDGGGSSAISLRRAGDSTAKVINSPSGSLRQCGMFLLVVTERKSDGNASNLFLSSDGSVVLTGSSLPLGKVLATDSGYRTVSAPEDVTVTAPSDYGTVENNTFYAADKSGTAQLTLHSGSAYGTSEVFIIDAITAVTVSAGGKTDSIKVHEGESFDVSAKAQYYGKTVYTDDDAFEYTVPAGVGTLDGNTVKTGRFSAGTGSITVLCHGKSDSIPVYIVPYFEDTQSHWCAEYVDKLGADGITVGIIENGARNFHPNEYITRQEFFTFLVRALKLKPNDFSSVTLPFADADEISDWAVNYIKAVYAKGYLKGASDADGNLFANPTDLISRQEAFSLLARVKPQNYSEDVISKTLSQFTDSGSISDWARGAACQMVKNNVVSGYNGQINPLGNISRAETSKVLGYIM